MNNKMIFAIVAVVIVVAAGVGAFVLINNDSSDKDTRTYGNRLMVFGNANGDDYIDSDDVSKLESIISDIENGGQWDKDSNPYADANQDGTIDSKDVEFVERMVKREAMTIYFVDTDMRVRSVDYPVKTVAGITTVTLEGLSVLNVESKVVARHGTNNAMDSIRFGPYLDLPAVGKSTAKAKCLDITMISNVSQKIDGGIDAVVTRSAYITEEQEAQLNELGISLIRMGFASMKTEQGSYLTLGYLMEAEERSHEVVKFLDEIEAYADSIVEKIPADKRPTVLCTAGNAVGPNVYVDTEWHVKAGATNNVTPAMIDGSTGGKHIQEGEVWQYGSDFIAQYNVNATTFNYDCDEQEVIDAWTTLKTYFGEGDYYPNNCAILNKAVPPAICVIYLEEFYYPDQVPAGTADGYMQKYVNEFMGVKDFDVTKHPFFVTYDDVKDKL